MASMVAKTKAEQMQEVTNFVLDRGACTEAIRRIHALGPETSGPPDDRELQAAHVKVYEARLALHRTVLARAELCLRRLEVKSQ